jgi:hypothetical protein
MCILGVEVPNGSYTLVPANEDEGQDPDQSPEGCETACADEGKPRFNH